jgi:hypothetical protein
MKKLSVPKIKFTWDPKRNYIGRNKLNSSTILVNGIFITCILLSLSSGFIDMAFFSGLSIENFHIGTIPFPARKLYMIIAIGFVFGKFWCAMNLGMLGELETRLKAKNKPWAKNLKKAALPWHVMHKFLITVSIITALSLSVNSIGSGIRAMEQNIKNMSDDAELLIELNNSVTEGSKEKRGADKNNIAAAKSAQDTAKTEVDRYYNRLVQYQEEYFAIPEEDKEAREAVINKIVREIPGASARNAIYFTKADLQKSIQKIASQNELLDSSSVYEEGIAYDKAQIEDTIIALADKEYRTPDGEIIRFLDDSGKPINVRMAISRLQNSIAKWQSDTGSVGESSKVFTLIATYMHADSKAGGMGVSEWMMMALIAIFGIVQEFLIYLFTPKATIDRRLLSQVSKYMEWKDDEEKERFLISVYKDYVGDGIINQEDYVAKCKKCVELMEDTEEDVIKKFSKKQKVKPVAALPKPKVAEDKQIRDKVSETELVGKENAYDPSAESAPIVEVETSKEDPAPIVEESTIVSANEKEETKKIFMKSAEAELEEMLQDSK